MTAPSSSPETNSGPFYLLLGEILRPHGIRGELKVRLLTDYPERIAEMDVVFLGTDPEKEMATAYQVEHLRMNQEYGLLKLTGIDDRDQADTLRQLYVMVRLDDAVPLDEGEYYLYQLIGLTVQDDTGVILGTIKEILETGANDVYIIETPVQKEILIPDTPETILKIDLPAGRMTIHLPDGLLP